MKCDNCGLEYDESLGACPNCGPVIPISLNPTADRVHALLTDGLFLAVCVLISASCFFAIVGGGGLPVIHILFMIFLWLAFSQAKNGFTDSTHIRKISGTVFAVYVIGFIAAGLLALCGVIASIALSAVSKTPDAANQIISNFTSSFSVDEKILNSVLSVSGIAVFIITAIVVAIMIIVNIFAYGRIHKFVQSVYRSIDMNSTNFVYVKDAKIWLFILGGLLLVSAALTGVSDKASVMSAISNACSGLTAIFSGVLINKYLAY